MVSVRNLRIRVGGEAPFLPRLGFFTRGGRDAGSPDSSRVDRGVTILDGVSFDLHRGQALGLVGESGSGKTTLGRAILRLIPVSAGTVRFEGVDVLAMRGAELRAWRRRAQIVFQDPGGSLNPRMKVFDIVAEPLRVHSAFADRDDLSRRVVSLLDRCGMPTSSADRYPHEFSGGQRQRIAIARALALEPALLVLDEPTSALDASIQAQIVNLLSDLRRERGLSYLFISHDLGVVSHLCDRIAVMKRGRIVEIGERVAVLASPEHEYTRELLAAAIGDGG